MLKMYNGLKKYFKPLIIPIIIYFILVPTLSYYEVFVSTKIGSIINSWTGKVPNFDILVNSALFIGLLYIIQAIWQYIAWVIAEMLFKRAGQNMKNDMFKHILKLPMSYFDGTTTGTVLEKGFANIRYLTPTLFSFPTKIVASLVALIATGYAMAKINLNFAILIIAIAPISLVISIIFVKILKNYERKNSNYQDKTTTSAENYISGIRTVKIFTKESELTKKFADLAEDKYQNDFKKSKLQTLQLSLDLFIQALLHIVSLFYGGYLVASGVISIGDLVAFQLLLNTLLSPIRTISTTITYLTESLISFERFDELLKAKEEVCDKGLSFKSLSNMIEFKNVSFSYPKLKDIQILDKINLCINKNERVALVGLSGSGKTTIGTLLMRFYDIDSGSILIDGKKIENYTIDSVRKSIGLVQQDTFIFADTIRNNIAFGNSSATDEEIFSAAKKAELYDFIMSLPQKLDTYVGDKGIMLSGGQKQRISIARVFLEDPPILILDEATSALDNKTEKAIQTTLKALSKYRTTITIAHRLSTISDSDIIYVLDKGTIVEYGNHDELMKNDGLYKNLYEVQNISKTE